MYDSKKIAVILSGCGVYDGSEIHEATLTLLAIKKQGADYEIFAPDIEQYHVVNHLTGKEMNEKRNVLVESARIARGNIKPLSAFRASDFDGLIFPGGFGAAKNLSDYAFKGAKAKINPEVKKAIIEVASANKPIGALCIAPTIIANVLGNVTLTIGQDEKTAKDLIKFGSTHINTKQCEVVVDKKNKIVTNPCYMLESTIVEIAEGAENVVKEMLKMM
ncbi:MAG: isoprenoid biosynthesis protein ElbB [Bacteroidetes bacterium GWA2_32_17]|nr:MAG: isoprenoid biosynthesis protein ElbB [Bacteroidetes bacterium GWA2_32_17]